MSTENNDKLELVGILEDGYGSCPKLLLKALDIGPSTKLVLCYLLSYAGKKDEAFPSVKMIAEDLDISSRTIIRCIKSAIDMKYITKCKKYNKKTGNVYNVYKLIFMNNYNKKEHDKMALVKKSRDKSDKLNGQKAQEEVTPGKSNKNSNNNTNNNKESTIIFFKDLDAIKKKEARKIKDTIWKFLNSVNRKPITPREANRWNAIALQDISECIISVGARRTFAGFMCMVNFEEKGKCFWYDAFNSTSSLSKMITQFNGKSHEIQEKYFAKYDKAVA